MESVATLKGKPKLHKCRRCKGSFVYDRTHVHICHGCKKDISAYALKVQYGHKCLNMRKDLNKSYKMGGKHEV